MLKHLRGHWVNKVITRISWKWSKYCIGTKRCAADRTGYNTVQTLLLADVDRLAQTVNKALNVLQTWTLTGMWTHTHTYIQAHTHAHNLMSLLLLCLIHLNIADPASSPLPALSACFFPHTWQWVYPISFNNINPGDMTVPGTGAWNSF